MKRFDKVEETKESHKYKGTNIIADSENAENTDYLNNKKNISKDKGFGKARKRKKQKKY